MSRTFPTLLFRKRPGVRLPRRSAPGLLFFLLFLAFLTLPYLLAWWRQGDAWVFTGFLFAVEDGNSYIAKMRLGALGAWLFTTPYTVEPQRGYLLFGPYLLLGKLAGNAASHGRLVFLFHAFRVLAALALAGATYRFLGLFLSGKGRILGTLMALLGGGLGWVPLLVGHQADLLPFAWYSPEGFGFLMLLGLPHLALARALMLALLLGWWRSGARGTAPRRLALLFLGALLLGWVHGFALVPLVVLVALGLAAARPYLPPTAFRHLLRAGLAVFLAAGPWLLYLVTLSWRDPFARAWTAQNFLPTPPGWILAWAYGWVLPWAGMGWLRLYRRQPARAWWAAGWVFTAFLLAHFPHPLQRRFLEGVWVALAGLTALGLPREGTHPLVRAASGSLPVGLSLVSTALFWLGLLHTARAPGFPSFRPAQEVAAFHALRAAAPPGAPVMAAYATGNALPAWAPVRVPLGLGPESAPFAPWQDRVRTFYRAETADTWRLDLLQAWDFRFVFYGPHERDLGGWNPETAPYLKRLARYGPYAVYRVVSYAAHP